MHDYKRMCFKFPCDDENIVISDKGWQRADFCVPLQWRRQRSKGVRSFRGQNILEPGHPDALLHFFRQKVYVFSRCFQNTKTADAAEIVSLSK